jgi:hypothetical protein
MGSWDEPSLFQLAVICLLIPLDLLHLYVEFTVLTLSGNGIFGVLHLAVLRLSPAELLLVLHRKMRVA